MSRLSYFQDLLSSLLDSYGSIRSSKEERSTLEVCDALLSGRGEVSGTHLAMTLLERFEQAEEEQQLEFFDLLLNEFDVDTQQMLEAAQAYSEDQSAENWRRLQVVGDARRQELFRRINRVPDGTGRLVRMREVLLKHLKATPALERLDYDFEHLFSSWFNRGFLVLRQIDWNTPASILEKIIAYEAVHAINDWDDLRNRLQPADRRCFAFFHPAMPNDPLIFVEVALTPDFPDSVQSILNLDREVENIDEVTTAVFYSISNCQAGLKGVSFGNFLIKQVANELAAELPQLKTFRTLSPVPTLMHWVSSFEKAETDTEDEALEELLATATELSSGQGDLSDADKQELMRKLVARYLLRARRSDNEPLDPVARFHLGNGASLTEVLPAADDSEKGLRQSAGAMVSYLYDLNAVDKNHEAYAHNRIVPTTKALEGLLS